MFIIHVTYLGNVACFAKIISSHNKWWEWRELCRVACEKMSIWCYLQFGVRPFNLNLSLKAPELRALDFITFDCSADFLTTSSIIQSPLSNDSYCTFEHLNNALLKTFVFNFKRAKGTRSCLKTLFSLVYLLIYEILSLLM